MNFNVIKKQGEVYLIKDFYNKSEALTHFNTLICEIPWRERSIKLFGKNILQPRLMCWMGDKGCSYKYSGTTFEPTPWTNTVLEIKNKIEKNLGESFNSALLNLYRNEKDSMGAHSDNEKELGKNPVIASFSLGAARPFIFRHKKTKEKIKLNLTDSSLLVMKGATQENWKHELPKLKTPTEARLNITFRRIFL